jgi:membrane associated rhomboid family serine protease
MLRPCARVTTFVLRVVVRVRAYWVIGGWIVLQLISMASDDNDGVAYVAHGGGLVAGAILFALMRPASVTLFECMDPEAEEAATPAAE